MADPTTTLTDAERESWIADGADAIRSLAGRPCPKREFVAALDCPYCLSEALLDMHTVLMAAARADEQERIITTAQVEADALRAEVAALRERVEAVLNPDGHANARDYGRAAVWADDVRAALATGGDRG